ncbi:MAG: hypothetical protein GKR89_07110 [Candidatus Latescibacteria bacterium]|nr:hypothetical protein [Candidatus Latescibacterota bacterium]
MKREIPASLRARLDQRATPKAQERANAHITFRGLFIGALLCVAIALGVPHTTMLLRGTPMGFSSSTPAAYCLLFFLLITVHVLLALPRRNWGLQWGELVTIAIMMMVAAAIPSRGVTGMLLPMITGTFYYASPENKWAEVIHPHLSKWMLMGDPEAVRGFYEGSPGETIIPWASWLPPLGYWLLFYAALYLTLISIAVILRRQWVEHERLAYPLAQVALAMIEDGGKPSLFKSIFKNRLMWLGFSITFLISSINALHHYYPAVPRIFLNTNMPFFGSNLPVNLNFLMVGFSFLINSTLSLSLWFFLLLYTLQQNILTAFGIDTLQAKLGPWSRPVTGHQMIGALAVMVVAGLWVGRHHLLQVWRKAVDKGSPVDDSDEIMSYRSALAGLFIGTAGMTLWLWQSGIPAWIAPLFVVSALIIFIGLTRAIVEAGIPTISPAMVPLGFVVSAVGVPALGAQGMVASAYSLIWVGELLVFMMAPLTNGLRLTSETTGNRRRLFWAIAGAMLITLAVSVYYTLYLAYDHGGVNLHGQFFGSSFPSYPSRFALRKLTQPSEASIDGWLWTLSGAAVMALLMIARQRLLWWPFHPLGFAVSAGWTMRYIWFSVFLAWLIKSAILRYGGIGLYNKVKPFFLGLVIGQFATGGFWLVIDSITGTVGNVIPVMF